MARNWKPFSGLALIGVLSSALSVHGCVPCGIFKRSLYLEAQLLDEETGDAISDAGVGGFLYTEGDATSYRDPLGATGEADRLPPDADGRFRLRFFAPEFSEVCRTGPFAPAGYDPPFPTPDRLELIVVRDECEQQVSIDINEDTVVDMSFPDNVLELKEPILVPACEGDVAP